MSELKPFVGFHSDFVLHQLISKWPDPALGDSDELDNDEWLLLTDDEISNIKIPHDDDVFVSNGESEGEFAEISSIPIF